MIKSFNKHVAVMVIFAMACYFRCSFSFINLSAHRILLAKLVMLKF